MYANYVTIYYFVAVVVGIMVYLCPCYVFGKNAEAVGQSCVLCGLVYLIDPANFWARVYIRGKLREDRGIAVSVLCCMWLIAMS